MFPLRNFVQQLQNNQTLPPWKSKTILFAVILALAVAAIFIPIIDLNLEQRLMLGIFIGAAGLWMTSAIPPFATAILVIVLQVYLIGIPNGSDSYQIFLNPIASPVLVLFFGGFILAIGATKHGLDQRMAKAFLRPFGQKPATVLLGVILVTALFSQFMSNTATTVMMIAILSPYYRGSEAREDLSKIFILAVPFASNIGGIGTIIGTPPNAVAASVLAGLGYPISFLKWMLIAAPIALVLLFFLWIVLLKLYPPDPEPMKITFAAPLAFGPRMAIVSGTFTVTVLLWMTEPLHAIPPALAALLPVAIFTVTGIINAQDLKRIDWDVLILVAGGLSLGVGMERTGLSTAIVNLVPFESLQLVVLTFAFGFITWIISIFMSNTSAANLLIPIAVAITVWSPQLAAVTVAFSAALGMSLPVSTPSNAIAFATGKVKSREMILTGTIVSIIGIVFVITVLLCLHRFTTVL